MLTTEQLDHWFRYHAPTPETAPCYAAVRDAELLLHRAIHNAVEQATQGVDITSLFDDVNAECRVFAVAIDYHAPDSADKTAAIRCVCLARNAANEALVAARDGCLGTPVHHWRSAGSMQGIAHAEVTKARFQANRAIALDGLIPARPVPEIVHTPVVVPAPVEPVTPPVDNAATSAAKPARRGK